MTYFPGVGESGDKGKLAPIPLFSTDPENIAKVVARVVVEGYPVTARFFEVPRNFPKGTVLKSYSLDEGEAVVELGNIEGMEVSGLALQALAHSVIQFDYIDSLKVVVGEETLWNRDKPDPSLLDQPVAPRLLDVMA